MITITASVFVEKYLVYIILLLLCLLFSGFFSSSELAYTMVNKLRLKKESEEGNKRSSLALKIAEDYDSTLSAILFGNNLVNIASSSIATTIFINLFAENNAISNETAATLSSIIVLIILIIFGEVIPKNIGTTLSYQVSKLFAWPIQIIKYIFYPITVSISLLVKGIVYIFPKKDVEEPSVTDEELMEMVETIEEEGLIDEDTGELLKSAIDFTDTDVYEIMTPRVDVFAFNIEDDINELITSKEIFLYSRIPVYEDSLDNIIGILSTKVLLKERLKGNKINVRRLMIEPMFVHKSKSISSLLEDLKNEHQHMAIIKDEFGGTMGIVTMEDIIEELVGDIWDESDKIEEEYVEKEEGLYIVDGSMNIDDFFDLVGYDEEYETDYTTVSGWVTEKLERFATKGDTFEFANFQITVLEAEEFTVEKIQVEIINSDKEED